MFIKFSRRGRVKKNFANRLRRASRVGLRFRTLSRQYWDMRMAVAYNIFTWFILTLTWLFESVFNSNQEQLIAEYETCLNFFRPGDTPALHVIQIHALRWWNFALNNLADHPKLNPSSVFQFTLICKVNVTAIFKQKLFWKNLYKHLM